MLILLTGGGAMPTAEARELQTMPDQAGVRIGPEEIRGYLEGLSARGRSRGTVQIYAARLRALYDGLPPDKRIAPGTLAAWRQALLERGYSPGTVNTHLSAANGLLDYLGRRDLQLMGQLEADSAARQPELTRVEYLRLLQAARTLGRERTYLLVKVFALTGIRVRELPQVTVEAVRRGRLPVRAEGGARDTPLPACLGRELLDYCRRQGLAAGDGVCHPEPPDHEPDPGDGGGPGPGPGRPGGGGQMHPPVPAEAVPGRPGGH